MNTKLAEIVQSWHLQPGSDTGVQIAAMLESLQAAGLLRASTAAVLLGEQYHLGGAEDTRRMAELLQIRESHRVLDLACYVGGPARQLAREYGCQVVGVDISEDCIAISQRLTELCGLNEKVQFICCSADAVPLPDESFTVAWSQGSFPHDLRWLPEIKRLLRSGGRLAFTGEIRRSADSPQSSHWGVPMLFLDEIADRLAASNFQVTHAEDISDFELEQGWLPARRKLAEDEEHYRSLLGDEWLRNAYESLDAEIAAWREQRAGEGRIVAVKE